MPSFDHDFAREKEDYLVNLVQENRGCFNPPCRVKAADKRCAKCRVAVYCSKRCQAAHWKRTHGHKGSCKMYCANTAPDTRPDGNGQRGPVAIGLYSVGLVDDDTLSKAMFDRSVCFVDEAKRVVEATRFGFRKPTFNLLAGVVYDMEKIRLVCAATFHEAGSNPSTPKIVTVNYVLHEVVGEGTHGERRMLYPATGGSGDVSDEIRRKVIEELYLFIRMVDDHGMAVQGITYGRGLMWMRDEEFRNGKDKKMLDEANDKDGNRIIFMPDMSYAMEDAMGAFSSVMKG